MNIVFYAGLTAPLRPQICTGFKGDINNISPSWSVGVTLTPASRFYSTDSKVDTASPIYKSWNSDHSSNNYKWFWSIVIIKYIITIQTFQRLNLVTRATANVIQQMLALIFRLDHYGNAEPMLILTGSEINL